MSLSLLNLSCYTGALTSPCSPWCVHGARCVLFSEIKYKKTINSLIRKSNQSKDTSRHNKNTATNIIVRRKEVKRLNWLRIRSPERAQLRSNYPIIVIQLTFPTVRVGRENTVKIAQFRRLPPPPRSCCRRRRKRPPASCSSRL